MADRPTTSTSRAGRPRMRSKSVYLPPCIPAAPKAGKLRTTSAQKHQQKVKVQVKVRQPLRNQIKQSM